LCLVVVLVLFFVGKWPGNSRFTFPLVLLVFVLVLRALIHPRLPGWGPGLLPMQSAENVQRGIY
jgi:hypothetical protein